jgi:hypothetical protein
MLLSEIKGWHYLITWDNPDPPNSSTMLAALRKLGKITLLATKTTAALSPKSHIDWTDVRSAIEANLSPVKGKAVYVNVRTGKTFHIGKATKWAWRRVPR